MIAHDFNRGDRVKYVGDLTPQFTGLTGVVHESGCLSESNVPVRFDNLPDPGTPNYRGRGPYGVLPENLVHIDSPAPETSAKPVQLEEPWI